jgi:hypothetical protein
MLAAQGLAPHVINAAMKGASEWDPFGWEERICRLGFLLLGRGDRGQRTIVLSSTSCAMALLESDHLDSIVFLVSPSCVSEALPANRGLPESTTIRSFRQYLSSKECVHQGELVIKIRGYWCDDQEHDLAPHVTSLPSWRIAYCLSGRK